MVSRSIDHVCVAIYNFAIVAGSAYIVFWREQSGWWFLLTLLLMCRSSEHE